MDGSRSTARKVIALAVLAAFDVIVDTVPTEVATEMAETVLREQDEDTSETAFLTMVSALFSDRSRYNRFLARLDHATGNVLTEEELQELAKEGDVPS